MTILQFLIGIIYLVIGVILHAIKNKSKKEVDITNTTGEILIDVLEEFIEIIFWQIALYKLLKK